MTILSSFELLFEPIIPPSPNTVIDPKNAPDPLVIQSFFALISNSGNASADLELKFIASNNYNLTFEKTFAVFDKTNTGFLPITPKITPGSKTTTAVVSFTLDSGETGLFLLQPNITDLVGGAITVPIPPLDTKFGTRGFVEVTSSSKASVLISPQTRGTFIDPATGKVLAEQAYPLPTTNSTNDFSF